MPLLTIQKLKQSLPRMTAAAIRARQPITEVWTQPAAGAPNANFMAPPPSAESPGWTLLHTGERWGAAPGTDPNAPPNVIKLWNIPLAGSNHWLRAAIQVPDVWHGQSVLLALESPDGQAPDLEAIAYLDGESLAGVDYWHMQTLLPEKAHDGLHELLIRCFVSYAQPFTGLSLLLRDPAVFQLARMMQTLLGVVEAYAESDPMRQKLLGWLNSAYNTLDLREGWQSASFVESASAALQALMASLDADRGSSERPVLISTGHAHLDVAWLWPLWRTRQKAAHTVATALRLMDRYPEYHFSMSQPQVYAYLKQDDPALYARLKQRVAEGRFEPVGMMWLEPDCNITSGESLVRQLIHGARFFEEEFGKINHVVWLPDVFGYSAAMPQLLRGCGVNCFMTTKISWSQFNRTPVDTFRWRGIDGSEVLTHFVTATEQPLKHHAEAQNYTYTGRMTSAEVYGTWNHYRQKAINSELLYIFGWGDGGGGPTEEMLETAHLLADMPNFPQVKPGRVEQYFERLYNRVWDNPDLPTWNGELYLEYHRGTYTSQARNKKANRAAELLYREAEWINAWASTLGGENQQPALDKGWELILLNQFHDILPGSSIAPVYVESAAQYTEIQQIGQNVRAASLNHLTSRFQGGQQAILALNSLPWDRRGMIQLTPDVDPRLLDLPQEPLSQQVTSISGEESLLVEVEAPSYGYSIIPLFKRTSGTAITSPGPLEVSQNSLQNTFLRLELDENGEIAGLRDLEYDHDVILPGYTGNQLVAYEDRPLNWDAWDIDIFYEEKPYPVTDILDWKVIEQGPLRAAIEITRRAGESTIRQRICMWHNSRRIDFVTEVDWQERQTLLRTLFPLNVNTNRATCEIQFGAVERPTHRNTSWDWARFEVSAHRWVDMSEGGYGVALMNNGKYGHSLNNTTLGLSLLKGGIHPDPDADRGLHHFTYSLYPHAGDWRQAEVVRRAYELNTPLRAFTVSTNGAAMEPVSFLRCDSDHVVVETVKVAHDGDGLIVRLYEAHNQRGPVHLSFSMPVRSAVQTDLLEREVGPVKVEGTGVRFGVRPYEVKTLRVRF